MVKKDVITGKGIALYILAVFISSLFVIFLVRGEESEIPFGTKFIFSLVYMLGILQDCIIPTLITLVISLVLKVKHIKQITFNAVWIFSGIAHCIMLLAIALMPNVSAMLIIFSLLVYLIPAFLYSLELMDLRNKESQDTDEDEPANNQDIVLYYYQNSDKRVGPFTLDQLMEKPIGVDTMVWKSGMSKWVKAEELVEIKERLTVCPPPITNEEKGESL